MSHITIILNRAVPFGADVTSATPEDERVTASVSFTPPDAMSEADVAQHLRRLYRQVRNLGTDNT